MEWIGTVCAAGSVTGPVGAGTGCGRVGSSVPRPLPSALRGWSGLFMVQNLFRQLDVAFRAPRAGVIRQDWLAEARRFRQPYAPWNDGLDRKSTRLNSSHR